jgi:hypothetical protein
MVLRYEELTVRPDEHIEKIEAFTGISGIDRSVLQRRFNTFAGDRERGYSPSEYIEPEPLTPEEEAALRGAAEEALAKTGYLDSEPRRPSEKRPRDKTRKKKRPPS